MRGCAIGESDPLARLVGEERRVGRQGVGRMAGARDEGRDNREDGVRGWRMEWGQDLRGCFRSHFGSSQHQFFPDFTWYGTGFWAKVGEWILGRSMSGQDSDVSPPVMLFFETCLLEDWGTATHTDTQGCAILASETAWRKPGGNCQA